MKLLSSILSPSQFLPHIYPSHTCLQISPCSAQGDALNDTGYLSKHFTVLLLFIINNMLLTLPL